MCWLLQNNTEKKEQKKKRENFSQYFKLGKMNSKNLFTCNNPLSQIAGSFNINLIDIIEKRLEPWYLRHVSHIKKYNKLFRKDFRELSNEILLKII